MPDSPDLTAQPPRPYSSAARADLAEPPEGGQRQLSRACPIGVAGWLGDGLKTVGEVEQHFAKACFAADQRLGEPAAVRWFLNWLDDSPRDEVRRELLQEVNRTLAERFVPEESATPSTAVSR